MQMAIDFKLIKAEVEHKNIIANLMQFYMYDFSEFTKNDVEEDGLYSGYHNLEDYWKEADNKYAYVIKKDEKYVGFALVKFNKSSERNYYSIAEFFILKKYRREGIGKEAAIRIFNLHKGEWQVHQIENNKPAQVFWSKIINEYTGGQCKEHTKNGKSIQDFKS